MTQPIYHDFTCTDGSNNQYGRRLGNKIYEFLEFRNGKLHHDVIDLDDYSEEEQKDYISAYYKSLSELRDIYGDESEWIIAECIFEQQSSLY